MQELNAHYQLRLRLNREQQTLRGLQGTAYPNIGLNGMPKAPGVTDRVGNLAVEIADLRARLDDMSKEIEKQQKGISSFFETINDGNIRTMLRLRFIRCLTWGEVAGVIGGGNTEEGVKTACYRYLALWKQKNRR